MAAKNYIDPIGYWCDPSGSVKKRVLSAAGRAKIAKAAKKRWAKVRKEAKKVVS